MTVFVGFLRISHPFGGHQLVRHLHLHSDFREGGHPFAPDNLIVDANVAAGLDLIVLIHAENRFSVFVFRIPVHRDKKIVAPSVVHRHICHFPSEVI